MISDSFPTDPTQRRVILVLDQHDIERCAIEPGAGDVLLHPEAHVIQFPVHLEGGVPAALLNMLDANLVRPGSILVQNPYAPDEYSDACSAPQQFALAKHLLFSEFCMYLGAREVRVEQVVLETASGKSTWDVRAGTLEAVGGATVEREAFTRLRSELSMRDEFAGGAPDLAGADRFLRSRHLWADRSMRGLLDMRAGSNQLRTRELTINLSTEARSNLSTVAGLALVIPGFVSLAADYRRVTSEQHEYTLRVTVTF